MKRYDSKNHVRDHMREAADEGAIYLTRLLRGEVDTTKESLLLAAQARGAMGAFTRYEATLSARDQTSVVVSKMLAGDNAEEFQRYIAASLPDHPAVREIPVPQLVSGETAA